jgi:TonB family protein
MPARELPRVAAKPGQKELPSLTPPALPSRSAPASSARETSPPPPPTPLGRPTGLAQGTGAAASVEGDFPFQWYLTAVQRRIYEQWTQPLNSAQGQKTIVVFEIGRNGEVARARVEKTSGDSTYDLAALRAVTNANPLPPLPEQYKGSMLRVHFGFEFTGRG